MDRAEREVGFGFVRKLYLIADDLELVLLKRVRMIGDSIMIVKGDVVLLRLVVRLRDWLMMLMLDSDLDLDSGLDEMRWLVVVVSALVPSSRRVHSVLKPYV